TLTQQDDMESIKQFLKEENELIGKTLFYYKTGNDTVDAILNVKQKYAEEKGISFIINAEVPENCNISSFDFSALLGNLIDNAIEASVNEKSPIINIIIKPVKKMFIISILNKCTKSDKSLVTGKSEKYLHGLGLISVKKTVKKYNGEFNIETSDDFFEVKIMIPMNENQP
ncbi:MAG: ATP-binding protein, partial [Clostridium sp.]|nr:ATP-binding protein [Clostridium sp.]